MQGFPLPHAPRGLAGTIPVPFSKSLAQRHLLAACLAGPPSAVRGYPEAEDAQLFLQALQQVGFQLQVDGQQVQVLGFAPKREAQLFLGNNGTGLRLLLAQLAAWPGRYFVDGVPRLRQRPLSPLLSALRQLGAEIQGDRLPLEVVGGSLQGEHVSVEASASSQFVSALLFLGARLPQGLTVEVLGELPSRPYVELTVEVLRAFGCQVREEGSCCRVQGPLQPQQVTVEGDWSAAAFPLVGVAVAGGEVEVQGVDLRSRQGDAVVVELLRQAGCELAGAPGSVRGRGPASGPLVASLRHCPDLFPALSVLVALRGGKLTGLAHLAGKESDRVQVMAAHLRRLGLSVEAGPHWLEAAGGGIPRAPREPLSPEGDHRIAMALAIAGLVTPGLALDQPQCVAKSWPDFFPLWQRLVRA